MINLKISRPKVGDARFRKSAKNIVLGLAVMAAVVGAGAYLAQPTMAEETGNYPPLIQKLVERFGLDQGEVEEVFTQHREERRTQMQARFEERLNQAVEEGQLTQEQSEAIVAKKEAMRADCEGINGSSLEERNQAREEHHEEITSWAEENGLEMEGLFGLGMGGPKGGHRGGSGFGK